MPQFTSIAAATAPGAYRHGNNLRLIVGKTGSKSWVLRFRSSGVVQMGLGSATTLSADRARRMANKLLGMVAEGTDPRIERRRAKHGDTFQQVLDRLLASKSTAWKGDLQQAQWRASLRDHAGKLLPMRVTQITVDHVLSVLHPIWGSETAARVQDRIEKVLAAAKSERLILDNVAQWKGNLQNLLTAKPAKKKAADEHHAALPYADLPALVLRLLACAGNGAKALLFCILTATRTDETRLARKSEIDRAAKLWTIPAERMKAGVQHIVPLSDQAMQIVDALWDQPGDLLFTGKDGKALGATALADKLCKGSDKGGLGFKGIATVHGMRSAFSDFIGDMTSFDAETREHCLAHQLDAVEGSYRRASAVAKRRAAMQVWANYCFGISKVVTLQLAA